MINITTNLKKPMEAMGWYTMRANTDATIQTTHVLFILLCSFMIRAPCKKLLCVKSSQPCRLLNSLKNTMITNTNQN
jgi:hypothetical protein